MLKPTQDKELKMVQIMMWHDSKRYQKEVLGRYVSFVGFTDYKFILHHSPDNDNMWRVSEATTGLFFAEETTPRKALQEANSILLERGRVSLRKALANAEQMFKDIPLRDTATP